MSLAAASACARATTLSADVNYSFIDQNGVGWVTLDGEVAITLMFTGKDGSLEIRGNRRTADSLLTDEGPEGESPGLDTSVWEGAVDESFALVDVTRKAETITFELDSGDEHLTGRCAPTNTDELARTTLYECSITGFAWDPIADLPELHHPIVLDANTDATTRIINTLTGGTKPGFGQRSVHEQ